MRASDADRQRVADVLSTAYADGRLSLDEFNERTASLWETKTVGQLAPLTADLGGRPPAVIGGQSTTLRLDDVAPIHTVAFMSSHQQPNNWVVPDTISSLCLMASDTYDFRTATFVSPNVELSVGTLWGSVILKVPAGVTVIDRTVCIMGAVTMKGLAPPQPGAPTIELKGFVLMGAIDVRGPEYATIAEKMGLP